MAKARVLEITLSVMGAVEDGYPTIEDSADSDRLVISVRVRGAKKYPWHWATAGWCSAIMGLAGTSLRGRYGPGGQPLPR